MRRLLFDSCVIIDIFSIDSRIIPLLASVATPCFLRYLLQEIPTIRTDTNFTSFITYIDSSEEDVLYAKIHEGALSEYDYVFYRATLNSDFIPFTNDQKLNRLCKSQGITSYWGLELFLFMVQYKAITKETALEYALLNKRVNNRIKDDHIQVFQESLENDRYPF